MYSLEGKSCIGSLQHLIAGDLELVVTEKELKILLHLVYLSGEN
jgi:hypothetical protein